MKTVISAVVALSVVSAGASASFLGHAPHPEFDLSSFTGKWEDLHAQLWARIQASAEETRSYIEELLANAKAMHSKDARAFADHDWSADIDAALTSWREHVDSLFDHIEESRAEWSASHESFDWSFGGHFDADGLIAGWKAQADEFVASFTGEWAAHSWSHSDRKLSALDHEVTLPEWISSWSLADHEWEWDSSAWEESHAAWSTHVNDVINSWSTHSWDLDFTWDHADWEAPTFEHDWTLPTFEHDWELPTFEHDWELPSHNGSGAGRKLI